MDKKKRVVITGIGTVNAIGKDSDQFWEGVLKGSNCISQKEFNFEWGNRRILAGVVNSKLKDAHIKNHESFNRCTKLLLSSAKEALYDSFCDNHYDFRDQIHCILGTSLGGMNEVENMIFDDSNNEYKYDFRKGFINYYFHKITKIIKKTFELQGESMTISTTCTSSSNAVGIGYNKIAYGDANIVLAGGGESISRFIYNGLRCMRALSSTEMKPFDKERDGTVLGEGSGIMILEELNHAIQRGAKIYCEIKNYISLSEAYHLLAPNTDGQIISKCIEFILQGEVKDVSKLVLLVSANGTKYNDESIANGINSFFANKKPYVACIKPLIGHTLGASGVIEGIAAVLAIKKQRILPIYGLENTRYMLSYITKVSKGNCEKILQICTGLGGNITGLLYEKYKKTKGVKT